MRWWYDELSKAYRKEVATDSNDDKNVRGGTQSQNARPALTALLEVRNIGVGASVRSVKEALQRTSDRRILNVCIYIRAAAAASSDADGCMTSEDRSSCSRALVECYEHDVLHIVQVRPRALVQLFGKCTADCPDPLQSCDGLEIEGGQAAVKAIPLKRSGTATDFAGERCEAHISGTKPCRGIVHHRWACMYGI